MKEKQEYENPYLKLVYFEAVDIITASGDTSETPSGGTSSDGWQGTTDSGGWI